MITRKSLVGVEISAKYFPYERDFFVSICEQQQRQNNNNNEKQKIVNFHLLSVPAHAYVTSLN